MPIYKYISRAISKKTQLIYTGQIATCNNGKITIKVIVLLKML